MWIPWSFHAPIPRCRAGWAGWQEAHSAGAGTAAPAKTSRKGGCDQSMILPQTLLWYLGAPAVIWNCLLSVVISCYLLSSCNFPTCSHTIGSEMRVLRCCSPSPPNSETLLKGHSVWHTIGIGLIVFKQWVHQWCNLIKYAWNPEFTLTLPQCAIHEVKI